MSVLLLADPAEVALVGGNNRAPSVTASFAKTRSHFEAGLNSYYPGATNERRRLDL